MAHLSNRMVEILVHPTPKDKISDWKREKPEFYSLLHKTLEEMVELAMNYGNPDGDKDRILHNLIKGIDAGVFSFGLDESGAITILTWNYTKGAYLPLDSKGFTKEEMTWTMSMAQYLMNTN